MRDVTLQELSNVGLNPFAVQLLLESWKTRPRPVPVAFRFQGVPFAIGFQPDALRFALEQVIPLLEDAIAAHQKAAAYLPRLIEARATAVAALKAKEN